MNATPCSHLESERVPLSKGNGFHCGVCSENVHTDEVEVPSESGPRYQLVKHEKTIKKGLPWGILDTHTKEILKLEKVKDGERLLEPRCFTKKSADSTCARLNQEPTVDSIPDSTGDSKKEIQKREREEKLVKAEARATLAENRFRELVDLDQQRMVIVKKAGEVIREMADDIKAVLYWFAHKKTHEKLFGKFATQEEWTQTAFSMCVNGVQYHINPNRRIPKVKNVPLLAEPKTKTTPSADGDNGDGLPDIPERQESEVEAKVKTAKAVESWQNNAGETVAHIVSIFDNFVEAFGPTERGMIYRQLLENINARLNEHRNKRKLLVVTPKKETVVA